jgi:predicted DNA-binding transcriptional regulator AlpA
MKTRNTNGENSMSLLSEEQVAELTGLAQSENPLPPQEFFSISELADRWRCSRATVYNRLRAVGAKVLDFGRPGKKSKKAVPASVVFQIEHLHTKRLA